MHFRIDSHSAQRALLRSLDHANNAHQEETVEMAGLMAEFDALVQECGSIKVRTNGGRKVSMQFG